MRGLSGKDWELAHRREGFTMEQLREDSAKWQTVLDVATRAESAMKRRRE